MPYDKTVWSETVGVTPARLSNLETQYEKAIADINTGIQPGISLFVDPVNGIDAAGRGTDVAKFKTIQYALNSLKKNLSGAGSVTIYLVAGTYAEDLDISYFSGAHELTIRNHLIGTPAGSPVITGGIGIRVFECTNSQIHLSGIKWDGVLDAGRSGAGLSARLYIDNCFTYSTKNPYGMLLVDCAEVYLNNVNFQNKTTAINVSGNSRLIINSNCSGSGNTTGILADTGSIVTLSGGGAISLGATTTFTAASGAQIFNTPSGKIHV